MPTDQSFDDDPYCTLTISLPAGLVPVYERFTDEFRVIGGVAESTPDIAATLLAGLTRRYAAPVAEFARRIAIAKMKDDYLDFDPDPEDTDPEDTDAEGTDAEGT